MLRSNDSRSNFQKHLRIWQFQASPIRLIKKEGEILCNSTNQKMSKRMTVSWKIRKLNSYIWRTWLRLSKPTKLRTAIKNQASLNLIWPKKIHLAIITSMIHISKLITSRRGINLMSVLKVYFYKIHYANFLSCQYSLQLFLITLHPKKSRTPLLNPHQKSLWKYQVIQHQQVQIKTFMR